ALPISAARRAGPGAASHRWSWLEGRVQWERGRSQEAVEAFARAVAQLERQSPPTDRFRRDVAPLYLEWVSALLDSADRLDDAADRSQMLRRARDAMERLKVAELRDYFRDDCVADLEAKTTPLDAVSERAAIVYPIPLPDRLELLVSVGGELARHRVAVGSERVVETARRFRASVENRLSLDYTQSGRQLYDWFARPYAEDLLSRGVDTLVFVPDGVVGAIPLAALQSGRGPLGEQFALAVTPGLALVDPRPLSRGRLRPLLAGLSRSSDGLAALEAVPDELAAIHALHGGRVLLDDDFERARLAREVAARRPAVLHIASHAVFTGDAQTSFLVAHDGPMSMEALAAVVGQNRFRDDPVELLMLSACETAAGDERAALGLAGMAVRAGARSAVGSLWAIDDAASRTLVVEFYRQLLDPEVGRAEALRRAQKALRADPRYTHPYYWSGFLMISDWR
ncbi:MAG: CHAT domain-containing protein, partial [Myxococcota bacterium]